MALVKSALFVDGENVTMCYQRMLAAGRVPLAGVLHKPDVYLWKADFGDGGLDRFINTDILRVSYYTSVAGDELFLEGVRSDISKMSYDTDMHRVDFYGRCQLYPKVYKKAKKSDRSRQVDINIAIDVMRHAYNDDIDVVYLFSGDGDFMRLVEDVMRCGKKVCVGAFSNGLHLPLRHSVDKFILLDDLFFQNPAQAQGGDARPDAEQQGRQDMFDDPSMLRWVTQQVELLARRTGAAKKPEWRLLGVFQIGTSGSYQVTAEDVNDGKLVNVRLDVDPRTLESTDDQAVVARWTAFYILGALDAYKANRLASL